MSKKKLERTICPICGDPMNAGQRARITIGWEYFRTKDAEDGWLKHRIVSFLEHKSVSKMVCRKCAENIADISAIRKPENVAQVTDKPRKKNTA